MAVKLLMTWDMVPGREQEYFEFLVREFVPGMQRLGIQPTEAWYTTYGEAPQMLTGFVAEEMKHREACNLPPLWRLAMVVLRDPKYDKLEAAAGAMRQRLDRIITRQRLTAKVRGPMPAVISRIQRFHRVQFIIQAPDAGVMRRLFAGLRAERPIRPAVKIAIDIDPVNLL